MRASTCYSQCTCTCPLARPYVCTPVCSSRALERLCLIANCIFTTFDYVIKTLVLVHVLQCINLWFTNMKQEENMVALLICGILLMLSLVDSCLSWFSLLMPSLVLVDAVFRAHWCRLSWSPGWLRLLWSPGWFRLLWSSRLCHLSWSLLIHAVSQALMLPWTRMVTGDSLVNILPNKIQYFSLYWKSRASCSSEFTRSRHSQVLCNHTCHACLECEICKRVPRESKPSLRAWSI